MCKEAENRHRKKWGKNRKSHILLLVMSGSLRINVTDGSAEFVPYRDKGRGDILRILTWTSCLNN